MSVCVRAGVCVCVLEKQTDIQTQSQTDRLVHFYVPHYCLTVNRFVLSEN